MFDFGFNKFLTSRLIKILYAILTVVAVLGGLGTGVVAGLGGEWLTALATPLVTMLALVFIRVYCEVAIVLFKIEEHLGALAHVADPNRQLEGGL